MSFGGRVMHNLTIANRSLIPVIGTILETLERSNVKVESQCRSGYCGACKVKLKKGSVGYTTQPIGFIKENEVLTCCAIPQSDVEIEIQ